MKNVMAISHLFDKVDPVQCPNIEPKPKNLLFFQ